MDPSDSNSSLVDPLRSHPGSGSTNSLSLQTSANVASHSLANPSLFSSANLSTILSASGSPLSPQLHERLHPYHEPYAFVVTITGARFAGTSLLFRFKGETNLACYPTPKMDCERSFQDFEKLSLHLLKYHPYNILPGLPPLATKADTKTKSIMEKFLKRLTLHPLLVRDSTFISFMTSSAEFHPFVPTDADVLLPAPSWSSKLKSYVMSKPKDIDIHLEQANQKTAEQMYCLKAMQKVLDKLTSSHKALANAYLDFSTKLQGLSTAETDPYLTGKWNDFGKRMQTASQIYNEHAAAEHFVMKDVLLTSLNYCNNLQQALGHRLQVLSLYDDACRDTERQKRHMERLKLTSQSLSANKVTSSVEKLESKHIVEGKCRSHFKMASEYILRDMVPMVAAWEEDMDAWMAEWSLVETEYERKVALNVWFKESLAG